jgi:transcriptional regulator with XRE-family HTH domain
MYFVKDKAMTARKSDLITPAQSRAARALLDITQPELAERSGLGLSTVVDFERSRRQVSERAIVELRAALERAGAQFIHDNRMIGVVMEKGRER